jgi:hypothetical protein
MTPVFVRATGHLFNARFSPVYAVDAGYGFYSPGFQRPAPRNVKYRFGGGLMGNAAGGVAGVPRAGRCAIHHAGYRLQQGRFEFSSEPLESREVERILFRRLSLRLGFSF